MSNEKPSASAAPADQVKDYIKLLHEKAGRITACHASLLALSREFDRTEIPRGPEGRVCPEFVFPSLLTGISPDVDGITPILWALEDLLEKLGEKKGGTQ